jgi:hypothetical protein
VKLVGGEQPKHALHTPLVDRAATGFPCQSPSPSRASCPRKFAAVVKTWPWMPSAQAAST